MWRERIYQQLFNTWCQVKQNVEDQGVYVCCQLAQAQSQWSKLIGIFKSGEPAPSWEVWASRCAQHSKPCLIGVLGFAKKAIYCTAAVLYVNLRVLNCQPGADSWDAHGTERNPFWEDNTTPTQEILRKSSRFGSFSPGGLAEVNNLCQFKTEAIFSSSIYLSSPLLVSALYNIWKTLPQFRNHFLFYSSGLRLLSTATL